jgi:hypothetical protein
MKRAAENLGVVDTGCYDLPLLLRTNAAAQNIGQALSFPSVTDLPETDELFGYAYMEHQLLKGEL